MAVTLTPVVTLKACELRSGRPSAGDRDCAARRQPPDLSRQPLAVAAFSRGTSGILAGGGRARRDRHDRTRLHAANVAQRQRGRSASRRSRRHPPAGIWRAEPVSDGGSADAGRIGLAVADRAAHTGRNEPGCPRHSEHAAERCDTGAVQLRRPNVEAGDVERHLPVSHVPEWRVPLRVSRVRAMGRASVTASIDLVKT
jgi:hypothetical protein